MPGDGVSGAFLQRRLNVVRRATARCQSPQHLGTIPVGKASIRVSADRFQSRPVDGGDRPITTPMITRGTYSNQYRHYLNAARGGKIRSSNQSETAGHF